jgi:hypothetical protein
VITQLVAWAAIAAGLFGVVQSVAGLRRPRRGRAWQFLGVSLVCTGTGMLLLAGSSAAFVAAIVLIACQLLILVLRRSERASS